MEQEKPSQGDTLFKKGIECLSHDHRQAADLFEMSACRGNMKGQYWIGFLYARGQGVPQNKRRSLKWLSKSAEQGYGPAQFTLGCMYLEDSMAEKAIEFFKQAAEQNYAVAQYNLGYLYLMGEVVQQDNEEAYVWLSAALAICNPENLSGFVRFGKRDLAKTDPSIIEKTLSALEIEMTDYELKQAKKELDKFFEKQNISPIEIDTEYDPLNEAKQGNADAQYHLGSQYDKGEGVEQDCGKAAEWYRKAAEQGHVDAQIKLVVQYHKMAVEGFAPAQHSLGLTYANGEGVEQDYTKAVEWYSRSAEQGNSVSENNLGLLYCEGKGVEKDCEKGVELLSRAAEQGHASSQVNLGNMYQEGINVEQDYAKAAEWYHKAAEQGQADAQLRLSGMYAKGLSVEQNFMKAAKWCLKAAKQGRPLALFNLGVMYVHGYGVEKNFPAAYALMLITAKEGDEDARERANEIKETLTAEQVMAGQKIAREWEQIIEANKQKNQ